MSSSSLIRAGRRLDDREPPGLAVVRGRRGEGSRDRAAHSGLVPPLVGEVPYRPLRSPGRRRRQAGTFLAAGLISAAAPGRRPPGSVSAAVSGIAAAVFGRSPAGQVDTARPATGRVRGCQR